ncbi:MAG: hypothetical protein HY827_01755 [Actinobacteria bacterium]|nr:hypothetical protein [Actinomycetota bacterium]
MTLLIEPRALNGALASLEADRPGDAEHAMSALWSLGMQDETEPFTVSRHETQLFLWSTLPRKYLTGVEGQLAVAEAIGEFFDRLGDRAKDLSTLCRLPVTRQIIDSFDRSWDLGFRLMCKELKRAGLGAPNLPDFEWGMTTGVLEAIARESIEDLIDDAIDAGMLIAGSTTFNKGCRQIAAGFLDSDQIPLELRQAVESRTWRKLIEDERLDRRIATADEPLRRLLEPAIRRAQAYESPIVAIEAPLLRWLLQYDNGTVPLTATGNLARAVVRAAASEHSELTRHNPYGAEPRGVDDLYQLQELADFALNAKLLRRSRKMLVATPLARTACTDRTVLAGAIERTLLKGEDFTSAVYESACAVLATAAPVTREALLDQVLDMVSTRWHTLDGSPPTHYEIYSPIAELNRLLETLGAMERRSYDEPYQLTTAGTRLIERALLTRMQRAMAQ